MNFEKLKIPNKIEYSRDLLDTASFSIGAYRSMIKNSVIDIELLLYLLSLKRIGDNIKIRGY